MLSYGVPLVVAINRFHTDSEEELSVIEECCKKHGCDFALSEVFAKGGEGGIDLAEKVIAACEKENSFKFLYDEKKPLKEKIETIAKNIYGADGVVYTANAEKNLAEIARLGFEEIPVCIAKTPLSLTDDPTKLGRPENFVITVKEVKLSAGAGFAVVLTGDIMTMPGLPKKPAAMIIDIDENGNTVGLS